jgi:hypothetical protein
MKRLLELKYSPIILKQLLLVIILFLIQSFLFAQHDSLVFKNGNIIEGEIKSMDKGVLTVETDYSKNDFTIEWSGLKEIYSKRPFLISLKNGQRFNGTIRSIDSVKQTIIEVSDGQKLLVSLDDIIYLKGLKSDFWSRVYANIDLGLSLTKANNLRQFNASTAMGYYADKWQLGLNYSDNRSRQDSVAQTKRIESGIVFTYYLPANWFAATSITTLSNTEQALKLRLSGKLGVGKYLKHTNRAYLGVSTGLNANHETYTNNTAAKSSLEGYAGVSANYFDIGDLSLLSNLYAYPSFTESGRWRADFMLDTKYKITSDFYIKLGASLNYDNRPAIAGNEIDYVYTFSVGWKL